MAAAVKKKNKIYIVHVHARISCTAVECREQRPRGHDDSLEKNVDYLDESANAFMTRSVSAWSNADGCCRAVGWVPPSAGLLSSRKPRAHSKGSWSKLVRAFFCRRLLLSSGALAWLWPDPTAPSGPPFSSSLAFLHDSSTRHRSVAKRRMSLRCPPIWVGGTLWIVLRLPHQDVDGCTADAEGGFCRVLGRPWSRFSQVPWSLAFGGRFLAWPLQPFSFGWLRCGLVVRVRRVFSLSQVQG